MTDESEFFEAFNFLLVCNKNSEDDKKTYEDCISAIGKKTISNRIIKSLLTDLNITNKSFTLNEKILRKLPSLFDCLPDSYEYYTINKYLIEFSKSNQLTEDFIDHISDQLSNLLNNKQENLHIAVTFLAILLCDFFKKLSKEDLEDTKDYLEEYLDDFPSDNFQIKDEKLFIFLKKLLNHQNKKIRAKTFSICCSLNIPIRLTKMLSLSKQSVNEKINNLILFIGPTGSGKTTLISYLYGVPYEKHHLHSYLIPKKGFENILQVGYGGTSETIAPEVISLGSLDLCDTAGFFDNREGDRGICSALSIPIIISQAEKVQAIVVVIEYESLDYSKGNRGEIFRKVCKSFGQLIKDFEKNYDKIKNILFVINEKSGLSIKKSEFKMKIENFLFEYEEEMKNEKFDLIIQEYNEKIDRVGLKLKIYKYCQSILTELKINQNLSEQDLNKFKSECLGLMKRLENELDVKNYLDKFLSHLEGIATEKNSLNMLTELEWDMLAKMIIEKEDEIHRLKSRMEEKNAEKLIVKLMMQEFNEELSLGEKLKSIVESDLSEDEMKIELIGFLEQNEFSREEAEELVKEFINADEDPDELEKEFINCIMEKKQRIFLVRCCSSHNDEDDKDKLIKRMEDICKKDNSNIDKKFFYFNLYQDQFEKVNEWAESTIEEITDILTELNLLNKKISVCNRQIKNKKEEIELNENRLKSLMSLQENIPIKLTKENFHIYQLNQTLLEQQKQFFYDYNQNIEYLENTISKILNEDSIDFHSEYKIDKRNFFGKKLGLWTTWIYEYPIFEPTSQNSRFKFLKRPKENIPIERVEISNVTHQNESIIFKTPINTMESSHDLNKIGLYHPDDEIGLSEIYPGIEEVTINSNQDNLFKTNGQFSLLKADLKKGILKIKYQSDAKADGFAAVRVFVKPKEFEKNKVLIVTKEKNIEIFRKLLKETKAKIQDLEKEQEKEKKFLEALQKGINAKEKTEKLFDLLNLLGYDKKKFVAKFFADFPQVLKLEDTNYLFKIRCLFDLNDDDLSERYQQLNKSQLKIYYYGGESERPFDLIDNARSLELVDPNDLEKLINAAHNAGVSFLLLNSILRRFNEINSETNNLNLYSHLKNFLYERQELQNSVEKWRRTYDAKKPIINLLEDIINLFNYEENKTFFLSRYNQLKNSSSVQSVLSKNFDFDSESIIPTSPQIESPKNQDENALNRSDSNLSEMQAINCFFRVMYDSICDDFQFEYISYENLQNVYCAAICINKLKSSKKDSESIIEFYLPQLIQSAKKEKLINEKDESYSFEIQKLLLSAAANNKSIAIKMYWLLTAEIKYVESKLKEALFSEKDLQYFKSLLSNLLMVKGDLCVDQEIFLTELKEICEGFKNNTLNKDTEYINFKSRHLFLFDSNKELTNVSKNHSKVLKSPSKPIKLSLNSANSSNLVIFKTGDDLRIDHLIQQAITLIDKVLKRENIDLCFTTYKVIPTGNKEGLIEFIDNTSSVPSLINTKFVKNIKDFLKLYQANHSFEKIDVSIETYKKSFTGFMLINYLFGIDGRSFDKVLVTQDGGIFNIDLRFLYGKEVKSKSFFNSKLDISLNDFLVCFFNDEQVKEMIDLCLKAFLIIRKERKILINLFTLMLNSSISRSDLNELVSRFLLQFDNETVKKEFKDKISKEFKSRLAKISNNVSNFLPKIN